MVDLDELDAMFATYEAYQNQDKGLTFLEKQIPLMSQELRLAREVVGAAKKVSACGDFISTVNFTADWSDLGQAITVYEQLKGNEQ